MAILYRILKAEEWDRLKEIVDPQFIPHVASAMAAVAEDSETGKLAGVQFLQLAMHCEPLVLSSPKVMFSRLHQMLLAELRSKPENKGLVLYAFPSSERVDKMAEYNGMKKLPYTVYAQEV